MTEKLGAAVRPWIVPLVTIIGAGFSAYLGVQVALAELRGNDARHDVQIQALQETDRRHDTDIRDIREKI